MSKADKKTREMSELERLVLSNLIKISNSSPDLRTQMKGLDLDSAEEITVDASGQKALIVKVPFRTLPHFKKIHQKLVQELEKLFSGQHVIIVGKRNILPTESRKNHVKRQLRPRSRTLTAVHQAILEDIVYPNDIVDQRIRVRLDASKKIRVYLSPKEKSTMAGKLNTFSAVYKHLTKKDAEFMFQEE